tara:strand:+ start:1908 stop:2369 length:462 start_codon:yes stop_codon:yes gene_type:complete
MGTITTALCNTFKQELLNGTHNFGSHTFKLALIKESPTDNYGAATTSYDNGSNSLTGGNNDEHANGNGYTTGGVTLAGTAVSLSGTTAFVDFNDPQFTSATLDADGCIIYNDTATNNPAVCVINFGSTQSSDNGTFTITMPTADASNAIIRVA